MPPHQNTMPADPVYSYPGTDINGFGYNQQQHPFYHANQYYPPTSNTSPT